MTCILLKQGCLFACSLGQVQAYHLSQTETALLLDHTYRVNPCSMVSAVAFRGRVLITGHFNGCLCLYDQSRERVHQAGHLPVRLRSSNESLLAISGGASLVTFDRLVHFGPENVIDCLPHQEHFLSATPQTLLLHSICHIPAVKAGTHSMARPDSPWVMLDVENDFVYLFGRGFWTRERRGVLLEQGTTPLDQVLCCRVRYEFLAVAGTLLVFG